MWFILQWSYGASWSGFLEYAESLLQPCKFHKGPIYSQRYFNKYSIWRSSKLSTKLTHGVISWYGFEIVSKSDCLIVQFLYDPSILSLSTISLLNVVCVFNNFRSTSKFWTKLTHGHTEYRPPWGSTIFQFYGVFSTSFTCAVKPWNRSVFTKSQFIKGLWRSNLANFVAVNGNLVRYLI